MHLNPYGEYAVLLAASLANNWPADRPGIVHRTRDAGMTMNFAHGTDDHAACRAVVDDWLRIVDSDRDEDRAAMLNLQMESVAAYPRLVDHNGEGWHLHYRDSNDALPFVLRAVISVGTSLHLVTRGMSRLRRCGAEPCTNVVVDVTRNGRQRYCSVRCANRAAVRRHRSRTAS